MPETDTLFLMPALSVAASAAGWACLRAIRKCDALLRKAAASAMFGVDEVRAVLASRA